MEIVCVILIPYYYLMKTLMLIWELMYSLNCFSVETPICYPENSGKLWAPWESCIDVIFWNEVAELSSLGKEVKKKDLVWEIVKNVQIKQPSTLIYMIALSSAVKMKIRTVYTKTKKDLKVEAFTKLLPLSMPMKYRRENI